MGISTRTVRKVRNCVKGEGGKKGHAKKEASDLEKKVANPEESFIKPILFH